MALKLRVIGNALFVAGEKVGWINQTLPATLEQNLRDTLDGIQLDTQFADETLQQVKEIKEAAKERDKKLTRFISWTRCRLQYYRSQVRIIVGQRDQARQWAEKTVADLTAQRDHAYELGKEHQRRDMQAELQHWKEQAATWEGHARSLWAQTNGGR